MQVCYTPGSIWRVHERLRGAERNDATKSEREGRRETVCLCLGPLYRGLAGDCMIFKVD